MEHRQKLDRCFALADYCAQIGTSFGPRIKTENDLDVLNRMGHAARDEIYTLRSKKNDAMGKKEGDGGAVSFFIGALLALALCVVLFSWQEARAFNRLTGSTATTWDAIFLNLRVVEAPANVEQ